MTKAKAKWISITEKEPRENVDLLLTDGRVIFIDKTYKDWWDRDDGDGLSLEWTAIFREELVQITHWAELPEFPNES